MEVILDTNALSAWLDGDPQFQPVLRDIHALYLSPIVLGEYRFGIAASRHRARYEHILADLLNEIDVLPLDDKVAKHYAEIRRELKANGTPIPWHDVWIAAQARCFNLPVLSKDKHFDTVPHLRCPLPTNLLFPPHFRLTLWCMLIRFVHNQAAAGFL